jgi:hypothetical protein
MSRRATILAKAGGGETIYGGSANSGRWVGDPTGSAGGGQDAQQHAALYLFVNFVICSAGSLSLLEIEWS